MVKAIREFNTNAKIFFDTFGKAMYYLTHPKVLAFVMWNGLVKYSFWICMFICLFSIIAYIIGWKKGKILAQGSVLTYIIIMMFNTAL